MMVSLVFVMMVTGQPGVCHDDHPGVCHDGQPGVCHDGQPGVCLDGHHFDVTF